MIGIWFTNGEKSGKRQNSVLFSKKTPKGEITHLCLGMKRKGHGEGWWNGAGGKVGDKPEFCDETIEEGCAREVQEEFGVTIPEFSKVGLLKFYTKGNPEVVNGHVYTATKWEGKLHDSDEMKQIRWFSVDEVPYEQMWVTDAHWLPVMLQGKLFQASYVFIDIHTLESKAIEIVEKL